MILTAVIGSADVSAAATLEAKWRDQQASLEKRVVEQSAKLARIRKHTP